MTLGLPWLVRALVGLLPALCFLGALLLLDSYKLVRLRLVMTVIVAGGAVAGVCYLVNGAVENAAGIDFGTWSRYGAPVLEESLKAMVVVVLIRTRRIGFL